MDWDSDFAHLPNCTCGNAPSSNHVCNGTGLCNHIHFPPFAYLPEEDDLDEHFYGSDDHGMYSPIRHWALVGEVVQTDYWIRPRVIIETRFGEQVLVNFHFEEGITKPTFFDWTALKAHSTSVIILYAVNRTFMDMNQGVRQENPDSIMVFPAKLSELTNEVDGYYAQQAHRCHHNEHAAAGEEGRGDIICFQCRKPETKEFKLSRCNCCKKATYCGKDCQIQHWKASHRKLCSHATMLSNLAALDFSVFHNFIDGKYEVPNPLTLQEKQERFRRARRIALYDMGLLSPELKPRTSRLATLLSAIQDKALSTDPHILFFASQKDWDIALPRSVKETFLYQSMNTFVNALQEDPQLRHFVVDWHLQQHLLPTSIFIGEQIFNSMVLALPIWQHKEGIGKISWIFEVCDIFSRYNSVYESIGENALVVLSCDDDCVLVKNRVSESLMYATDQLETVAGVGVIQATDNPDEMVIRVLRSSAHKCWCPAVIQSIVTEQDLPDNLYTLWIREDIEFVGSFNPPNKEQSLLHQLTDIKYLDPIKYLNPMEQLQILAIMEKIQRWAMLRREVEEASFQEEENGGEQKSPIVVNKNTSAAIKHKCASCSLCKAKSAFSKNQLNTKGALARCKDYIAS